MIHNHLKQLIDNRTMTAAEAKQYIDQGLKSTIKIMTDPEKPKTRLEEAQQELKTLQEKQEIIKHQQWQLKVEETFLKKRIKATKEEMELLTPKEG